MCTGRVDLSFVLRAFARGADGVFIGGCWPGECHYITEGNYDALANMHICRKLMERVGIEPTRLRLEWIAASEGSRFAEVMNEFVQNLREQGPLGATEGALKDRLDAVTRLVPYIKLVERERLRAPEKTEAAYNAYYNSDEVNALFDEIVTDKLAISRILGLLEAAPLSTSEIAEALELDPSDVSKQMNSSSRHGLVRYDTELKRYALA